jgi:hypothetical protein
MGTGSIVARAGLFGATGSNTDPIPLGGMRNKVDETDFVRPLNLRTEVPAILAQEC